MKRPKKPLVATWYAERRKIDGHWLDARGAGFVTEFFSRALLSAKRPVTMPGWEVVPCRVRPLTSKKRNAKRTR